MTCTINPRRDTRVTNVTANIGPAMADMMAALAPHFPMARHLAEIYAGGSGRSGSVRAITPLMTHRVRWAMPEHFPSNSHQMTRRPNSERKGARTVRSERPGANLGNLSPYGIRTLSITWITPLLARISALMTLASFTRTVVSYLPPVASTRRVLPFTVATSSR